MVDPMGKKGKVIIFTSQGLVRSVHRGQDFPALISHEARWPSLGSEARGAMGRGDAKRKGEMGIWKRKEV